MVADLIMDFTHIQQASRALNHAVELTAGLKLYTGWSEYREPKSSSPYTDYTSTAFNGDAL